MVLKVAPILLVSLFLAQQALADVNGVARVNDGDTLEIDGQRIRLHAIDSPEKRQPCYLDGKPWRCGEAATKALAAKIGSRLVRCEERDLDRFGRIIAICYAGGEDLNRWMISEGWAMAYRLYSNDYVDEEAKARIARKGIWRGDFMPPWDWRKMKR